MTQAISPKFNPEKVVLFSFAGAILLFTCLLMLPPCHNGSLSWIDALFTSASAVCVTGLASIDVGQDLTRAGQVVLLSAIQVGGLGIMTFSVFFTLIFRGRATLVSRLSVGLTPHRADAGDLLHVLRSVLVMTLCFELAGTALLFLRFRHMHDLPEAVFSSVFHAVSAFCNAGYGLYSDSLMGFRDEALVPLCVAGLIICGGLGFMVIDELRLWLRSARRGGRPFRLTVHTRVCLIASAAFLLIGTAVIFALEQDNRLKGMPPASALLNAFFLSVTSRTAGFNTVDTGSLMNATLFFVMFLMFIGGCPGSTAGGIKVTTATILASLVKDQARVRRMTSVFKRKVPDQTVAKSLAIFAAGLTVVLVFTFLLQLTEKAGAPEGPAGAGFLQLAFETVSAFGTVGLSTGVTPSLSAAGKLLIIVLMYVGRVGPLTLAVAVITRRKSEPRFEYVEEEVVVG